jgi:hypothetical protein
MGDQYGPPREKVYILDTCVLGLIAEHNPEVIADLQTFKRSGAKLVLSHYASVQAKKAPDPMTRATQLSFVRDFPIEVQSRPSYADQLAYLDGPHNLPPELRREYFNKHPELQEYFKRHPELHGETISPEAIKRFYEQNPKIMRGINPKDPQSRARRLRPARRFLPLRHD